MIRIKNVFLFLLMCLIIACAPKKESNKKAELLKLKAQQNDLNQKIQKLESDISSKDTSAAARQLEKMKNVGITVMQPDTFNHYIEVQARVEGDKDVTLSAQMPGTVSKLTVAAGDKVKKGQLLAAIDDKAAEQGLGEVRTQYELAKLFSCGKNLWDQGIGSEVQYLQAKANKESLERRYAGAQEQYNLSRIISPIDGTVDEVSIKVGQTVAPGMPTIRVVNLSEMKIKGEVAESFISNVKEGNPVIVYFPDQHREIKAKLTYSGQAINRLNRTFNVEVKLKPEDASVHPNQVAILKILDYSVSSSFAIPVGAVQKSSNGEYVFVAKENRGKNIAIRRTILSGMTYNGVAEVRSGLIQGDKVITMGYQNITEEMPLSFK